MPEDKMYEVVDAIKQHFEKYSRITILDFIMDDLKRRPSLEKVVEADVLYALTQLDGETTIKGNKRNNYDFRLPNLDMEIEFKATRKGSKGQLDEIRCGKVSGKAQYYLLLAPNNNEKVEELFLELKSKNNKMVVKEFSGKYEYILALIESASIAMPT